MPVILSAVGASLCALVVVLAAEWTSAQAVAGDTASTERWFVDHAGRVRGVRRVVSAFDRHVWGGAMIGFGLIAVLGAAAAVGSILVMLDDGARFARVDESVAAWGGEHATSTSTATLKAITMLGDTIVLLGVMTVIGLVAMWRRPGTNWSIPGFLLTVGLGVSILNSGLKWLIMRDRPDVEHLASSGGSSFPSGHTAAAAACWAAIALVIAGRLRLGTRRFAAATAVAIAVLVAASRVMLGVHWLTDVVAGLVVGWSWFFLVALIFGGRIHRFGEPAERIHDAEHLATTVRCDDVQPDTEQFDTERFDAVQPDTEHRVHEGASS